MESFRRRRFPGLALLARTHFPQKGPRVNPQLVPIIPVEPDRILAHAFGAQRLGRSLKHGQACRCQLRSLSRLAIALAALFIAERARTGIPQEREWIMGRMPILPLDIHPGTGADVYFD
jgi:hypothetical protein